MKKFSIRLFLKPDDRILEKKMFFSCFLKADYLFEIKTLEDLKYYILFIMFSDDVKNILKESGEYGLDVNHINTVFVVYFRAENGMTYHHRIEIGFTDMTDEKKLKQIYKEFSIVLEKNSPFDIADMLNFLDKDEKLFLKILCKKT